MINQQHIIQRLSASATLNEYKKFALLDSYICLIDETFDSLQHRTLRTGLLFLLQGHGYLSCYGESIELKAGDIMFYPINLLLQGSIPSDQPPILFIAINVNVDLLLKLTKKMTLKPQKHTAKHLSHCQMSPMIETALFNILALIDAPEAQTVLLEGRETELYYYLLQSPLRGHLQELVKPDSALNKVRLATQFIAENFNKKLSVDEIAEEVGMSVASLYQHFRQLTQITPIQYQKQLRLSEARRLITTYPITMAQVAFAVGYESPNQFSREYKRMFGSSPKKDVTPTRFF